MSVALVKEVVTPKLFVFENPEVVSKKGCSHKKAGVSSEVYAFKTEQEIKNMIQCFNMAIEEATDENKKQIARRNKLIFLIGINIGIRGGDLCSVKWSYFFDKDKEDNIIFKDYYVIQPEKTRNKHKFVKLFFNQTVKTAIKSYISLYPISDLESYVFQSRKGGTPIMVSSLNQILKDTAKRANITQNIGTHSLRKTWGFWCWHSADNKSKALVTLQNCFNHSDLQTTLKYIGLLDNEISDMYNSIELGLDMI